MLPPPPGERRLRADPGSPLFMRRYNILIGEGFVHEEAARYAERRISKEAMRRGRRMRRKWYKEVVRKFNPTKEEYEEMINDMYDVHAWRDPWEYMYPEEGSEFDEDYMPSEEE